MLADIISKLAVGNSCDAETLSAADRRRRSGCELAPTYRLTPSGWRQARGGKAVVVTRSVVGTKAEKTAEFDAVRHLVFGPDGVAVAFAASRQGKWRVVCGANECPAVDEIGLVRFSEDGDRIVYGARLDRELWWKALELR